MAWLSLNALDALEERELRSHLGSCPACGAYWREMSTLTGKLSSTPLTSRLEASDRFHQQVVRAVHNEGKDERGEGFKHWRVLAWRVALPVVGVVAVAVAMLSPGLMRPRTPQQGSVTLPSRTPHPVDLEPTVFNYRMVANASLDGLDELLMRQGNRNLPPESRSLGTIRAGATRLE